MTQAVQAGVQVDGLTLADGQSVTLNNGALTLTRLTESRYVVKENNGDQMWCFDDIGDGFVALRDTDKNGTFDSLVSSSGDPHFQTERGIESITDADSLHAFMTLGGRVYGGEYDVQTNYTIVDGEGQVAMETTVPVNGVTVNKEGSVTFRDNNGYLQSFSFDFEGAMSFTGGVAQVSEGDLIQGGRALTRLAYNANVEDSLFQIDEKGRWGLMGVGTFIDTLGNVKAGEVDRSGDWYAKHELADRLADHRRQKMADNVGEAYGIAMVTNDIILKVDEKVETDEEQDKTEQASSAEMQKLINESQLVKPVEAAAEAAT